MEGVSIGPLVDPGSRGWSACARLFAVVWQLELFVWGTVNAAGVGYRVEPARWVGQLEGPALQPHLGNFRYVCSKQFGRDGSELPQ